MSGQSQPPVEIGLRALIADIVREVFRDELHKLAAPPPDGYLSTRCAAALADVAPGTVRRWIREGRLTGHHAGRSVRVRRSDLDRFLQIGPRRSHDMTPEALARRDFG